MKPIEIKVSNDISVDSAIQYLESCIPEATKLSPEFSLIFPQVRSCISDFSEKAKKLAKDGTTIHIQKEFTFPEVSIFVVLEHPKKVGFLERIAGIFKR